MRIGQAGAPAQAPASRRAAPRRHGESFAVTEDDVGDAPELPAATASAQASAVVVLSAGPAGGGLQADTAANRKAAGHGRAMLGALAGLQAAALGGDGAAAHQALAELACAVPEAADPGLGAVLQAIAQRAAIELARSE